MTGIPSAPPTGKATISIKYMTPMLWVIAHSTLAHADMRNPRSRDLRTPSKSMAGPITNPKSDVSVPHHP
eukprot:scaffold348_cov329-Pavlova_lutheri.AAC.22